MRGLRLGLVAYPGLGGSGIVATELADRLARMGHRVHLFATERPFRLPPGSPVRYVPVDLPFYPVFPGPLYTLSLAGVLEREAARLGLELVHTHYAIPHAAAAYLAFGEGFPLVHTLHGTDVSLLGMDPAFHGPTKRALRAARATTAVSRALAREAERAFGVRPAVIHNAVDPERFRPRPERKGLYAEEGEWLLLHASNFRPIKRVPDIVRAFAKVRRKVEARLLLLGKGPEEGEARRVAEELGVLPFVTFHPPTPRPEEVLGAADLFLLASEEESFGQAALEALASGVPVVATAVGGVPELVTPEVGRLVELGDLEGYAEAILELLASPDLPGLRRRARAYAVAEFHPERITGQYLGVYEEALG
ncbi:N-acetyl-alpha-D-glucosaminyl L-malate synthase BshA [Thermus thermamylovorans]|uniref:N-acetyl-alpha-D-glucosaminyl L-malate synthase BshA n=1 Tax=Thermus thermamylovorans TaxID=2509362 RepID=A0A4Q9B6Z1_9DEIN|nr:N-acetyl-alpha-D-glucosaminyl L-malate synthase BshA [Thermus thermamylovorans]TBH21905.1 N-acetyl-alpha-D-glucosaminyl L-malate synthase BshA [Thermus thermamylovorans]